MSGFGDTGGVSFPWHCQVILLKDLLLPSGIPFTKPIPSLEISSFLCVIGQFWADAEFKALPEPVLIGIY